MSNPEPEGDATVVSMVDFARETFVQAVEYHRLMHQQLLDFRARLYAIEVAHDPRIRQLIDDTAAEAQQHGALLDALPAGEFIDRLRGHLAS